ncbi:chorismate mutase [Streptomyces sp. NPDC003007]
MRSPFLRSAFTVPATVPATVAAAVSLALAGAGPAAADVHRPAPAAARGTAAAHGLTPLTELFAQRLLLADKVAAAKYGTATPIDDPVREAQILADVRARAAGTGLDPEAVAAVFRNQIEGEQAGAARSLRPLGRTSGRAPHRTP